MSIPASSIVSAAAMATIAGAMLSSAPWIRALKMPYVDVAASPAMWNGSAHKLAPAGAAKFMRRGTIASATSPLILGKLTMSDFGDVDGQR